MRKINVSIAVPLVLILILFIAFSINSFYQRKIIILQSYYTDFEWTNSIQKGLESVLSKQSLVKYKTYYMDVKNPNKNFLLKTCEFADKLLDSEKPDVIIAVDDPAQNLIAKYYTLPTDPALVFVAVNDTIGKYGYDKAKNVTGILERIPLEAFGEMVTLLLKDKIKDRKIRVMHIGAYANTMLLDDRYIKNFSSWNNIEIVPSKLVTTFTQWKAAVTDANASADVLLIINSAKELQENEEKDSKIYTTKEILEWTCKNFEGLSLGVNDFLVTEGLPMAVCVSPTEIGADGARIALKIINEKIPQNKVSEQIPVIIHKGFIISLNDEDVKKMGCKLPSIYYAFSNFVKNGVR